MEDSKGAPIPANKQLQTDNAEGVPEDTLTCSKDDAGMEDTRRNSQRQTFITTRGCNEYELVAGVSLELASGINYVSRNESIVCLNERREREVLVSQIGELQSTLSELSQKVDGIKLENSRLLSDNEVLVNYIANLVYDFDLTY
nr:unnamed protein product [Callosobruchus chinensis]